MLACRPVSLKPRRSLMSKKTVGAIGTFRKQPLSSAPPVAVGTSPVCVGTGIA
jgi:hypothetical protein